MTVMTGATGPMFGYYTAEIVESQPEQWRELGKQIKGYCICTGDLAGYIRAPSFRIFWPLEDQ